MALNAAAFAAEPAQAGNSTNAAGPRIQFDSTNYDFGQVLAGEPVKHVFTFTNAGGRDLVLSKVQTGCGCTRAGDWTRLAKPGETGIIPIELNTAGFIGKVDKAVTVTCNDPTQAVVALQLRGAARKGMDIVPSVAVLSLQPDSPFGAATVRITNRLEQPLLLSAPRSTNDSVGAQLRTNVFGRDYAVTISNTAALPTGALAANITIGTSLTNLPAINILTLVNVSPTFTVVPSQINLAPGPLVTGQVAYVSIMNNGTNRVSLYEPRVSASGVEVSLKETKPGAAFTAILSFPAGFKLPAGQRESFSVRTGHPQCPIVQVPICHILDPAPTAPWSKGTAAQVVTAPLPLVFQTKALGALKLDQEQEEAIDQLKKHFIDEVGGFSQDPADPAYLARWRKARPEMDASLEGVIGRRGVARLAQAIPSPESASE